MPSKKHTTVVLAKSLESIKEKLMPIYGLKNILSAGLLLFSKLSDSEQKKIINDVHKMGSKNKKTTPSQKRAEVKNALGVIREMVSGDKPSITHQFLSKEDSRLLASELCRHVVLQRELGAERPLSPAEQAADDEADAYSDSVKKKRTAGRREPSKAS